MLTVKRKEGIATMSNDEKVEGEVSYKQSNNKTYISVKQNSFSKEPSLVRALIRAFYPTFLHGMAYKFFHDILMFAGPFLLK